MGGTVDLNDLAGTQRRDLPGARTRRFANRYRAVSARAAGANREGGGCRGGGARRDGRHGGGNSRGDLCTRRGGCRTVAPDRARTGLGPAVTPHRGYHTDTSNHDEQNHNCGDDEKPLPRPPGFTCSLRRPLRWLERTPSRSRLGYGISSEGARVFGTECRLVEGSDPIGVGRCVSRSGTISLRRRLGPRVGWKQPLCFLIRLAGVASGVRVARHGRSYSRVALPRRRPGGDICRATRTPPEAGRRATRTSPVFGASVGRRGRSALELCIGQSVVSRSIERAGSWPSISSHSGTSPKSNGRG